MKRLAKKKNKLKGYRPSFATDSSSSTGPGEANCDGCHTGTEIGA